jgi:phage host-nuclease inhibitor protein Gam
MLNKDELKILAFKERIAELVVSYEDRIADIRADYTLSVEQMNAKIQELQNQLDEFKDAKDNVAVPEKD